MKGPFQNWEKMITLPIAVLGRGISGSGVCSLLERLGLKYRVFDDQGCVITPSKLKSSSIVIVSPGFRPDHPWLLMARRMKKKYLVSSILHHFSQILQSPQLQGQTVNLRLLHYSVIYLISRVTTPQQLEILVFHYRN